MKAILFGATGMVGKGVLLECLADPEVQSVLAVGRSSCGIRDPKLQELLLADLAALPSQGPALGGFDACFFCLGVSSAGMSEADYRRLTYDLTLEAARTLRAANPGMTFCYVSGKGTDASGAGGIMWARVKGETENALRQLGFKAVYLFRPGYIHPAKGIRSRTTLYRIVYAVMGPLYPLWRLLFPGHVSTSAEVGRAMIRAALRGHSGAVLEVSEINALGGSPAPRGP